MTTLAPARQTAEARLAAVDPAVCARTRKALDSVVTGLSACLPQGLLGLREVSGAEHARQPST